ncbi:hypothetical protein BO78DRAFT_97765 [Aspergillus sclerotiicarbonarius CBS 121057]|uniref:Uncharacterized protein n=1 Tax=Aspergillus sclerotiicarbonarius (strain CBS 121057 / IBT 28362) TaxID=1448318 RepID=A0A319EPL3_ASPSB|nr:hypothetical protein BO78DRAFT_97765 [Aspergillus sclerotiicarbonarius CBS 121057]
MIRFFHKLSSFLSSIFFSLTFETPILVLPMELVLTASTACAAGWVRKRCDHSSFFLIRICSKSCYCLATVINTPTIERQLFRIINNSQVS